MSFTAGKCVASQDWTTCGSTKLESHSDVSMVCGQTGNTCCAGRQWLRRQSQHALGIVQIKHAMLIGSLWLFLKEQVNLREHTDTSEQLVRGMLPIGG